LVSLSFALAAIVALAGVEARTPKFDPATKRVRVVYLGDAWGAGSPIYEIYKDPLFSATPVPASATHAGGVANMSRFIRLYLPRTYNDFVTYFDVVILSDTEAPYYTSKQIHWFSRGVSDAGQGLLMVGGREIQLGEWGGTTVEEALPSDFLGTQTVEKPFWAIPANPDNEIVKALPMNKLPQYLGMILVAPKPDAELILTSRPGSHPVLLYHEYGKGASMFHTPDWTPLWGQYVNRWEYFGDYVCDMLYYLSGLKVPDDPALMHTLRQYFGDYDVRKQMILNLAEFIDKFGANTGALDKKLGDLHQDRAEASRLYVEQDYDGALTKIRQVLDELEEVQDFALRLKDRAMFWIYITEVSAVTGVSLIAGTAVWFLMVKRKLYREVSVTRIKGLE